MVSVTLKKKKKFKEQLCITFSPQTEDSSKSQYLSMLQVRLFQCNLIFTCNLILINMAQFDQSDI